jgi:uncharacterized protein YfaP (DUF2135 family)
VATLVLSSACSKTEAPRAIINDYVTGVQVLGQEATSAVLTDQLPAGTPDGPTVKDAPETTVVNGGSMQTPIEGSAPFSKVRVGIELVANSTPAPTDATPAPPVVPADGTPASGFVEITLKSPTDKADIVLTVAQALPGTVFVFHYAVVDASGKQGKSKRQTVNAIQVGTGDVQVSISWDVDSDVDLHVIDPNSDEIYYDEPESSSGGELDLDSNAECDLDHKRNENITWKKAPAGKYAVKVDYWASCGVASSHYVVTVRVNGQPTRTFTGELTGKGDEGGRGDGKDITTFTVATTTT